MTGSPLPHRPGRRLPDPGFWAGKHVLLTGHSGFIGSWAALWLERLGAEVFGLAQRPQHSPDLYTEVGVAASLASQFLDICDRSKVASLMEMCRLDLVLHLAAQTSAASALQDPVRTFAVNVMGTVNLLDTLRRQPRLKAVLVVTSDEVYADAGDGRLVAEDRPLGGTTPSSASQTAREMVAATYAKSFYDQAGVAVATARGGAAIGGGDYAPDRLMSDLIRAWEAGETPILRQPGAVRPWQHVLDCVAGYLVYLEALASGPEIPRALNFGPAPDTSSVTVEEIATAAASGLGTTQGWRPEPGALPVGAAVRALDTRLARERLGFESRLDPLQAVAWALDWRRAVADGAHPRAVTLSQIEAYEAL